jgi:FkbM family methyltransferase
MPQRRTFLKVIRRSLLLMSRVQLALDPRYLFARFFHGEALVEVNGSIMRLDLAHDMGISKDLFQFRKREHVVTDYLFTKGILRQGDVVLDIGANIGYYALLESKLVGPSGQVYAIEPVSSNYRMLARNIALNDIKNIRTFNLAVGSKMGMENIYVASAGNISSLIRREGPTYVRTEQVQVVTVDDFVHTQDIQPVLIRMDVEGYEKEIIKGMTQTLQHKPKLLIEVHPLFMSYEELDTIFSTLQRYGYDRVVVMYERNKLWMKRNGDPKSSLVWVTDKIEGRENALGVGSISHMDLGQLRATLKNYRSAFHVLFP